MIRNNGGGVIVVDGKPYYDNRTPAQVASQAFGGTANLYRDPKAYGYLPFGDMGNNNTRNTVKRPQFTPNAFTQNQLANLGNSSAPQWMMDAYSNRIGGMGGNANPQVPFGVNQSGFVGQPPMVQPQPQAQNRAMVTGPSGKSLPASYTTPVSK